MLTLTTLFSGSKGNCTLIESDRCKILVDAGFSYAKIAEYLKLVEVDVNQIDAIFVTHEHTDHTSALREWANTHSCPIFVHPNTSSQLEWDCFEPTFLTDKMTVCDVEIEYTPLSHDSASCCGFRFFDGHQYVAVVTDTGIITEQNLQFLSPCKTVLLESNHDLYMLKIGDYAYPLKKRVMSTKGHLSNEQSAEILEKLLKIGNLKNIVLGHLSQNNNTHELAFYNAMRVLTKLKLVEGKDVGVFVADQFEIGKKV